MSSATDDPSRRQVIAGAIGAGFALAVQPVSATTITTSASGLDAGDVTIPSAIGAFPAYRAAPKKHGKKLPVVLVVHEIFGVHEHIKDVCRRLAKEGYFAVAPDLISRWGDVTTLTDNKEIMAVVAKVPDAAVMTSLDATAAWAKGTGIADVTRLGVTGFCWGGRQVWLYAANTDANPKPKAGVAWYGRLTGDRDDRRPGHPLDLAGRLTAPVLGLYGAEDQGIPQSSVTAMQTALGAGSAAAKRSEIKVYPQAGHAFFADYRPSYRPEAAADGWKRMLAWFAANKVR
ncbi:MAG TPA: dienelactone hydrolase family protein [Streptosporangiaceae bacterium]|nr:dienelactone hydrolase family protein [Streptosporangiaceae bacterium]